MDILKLVDFVKSWEIFHKIEWEYEQIVSDFDFWDFIESWDFLYVESEWNFEKINKNKTTLFILDNLLPENILSYLKNNNIELAVFTILDLNFGLSSYWNKIWLSKLDLWDLINQNISIYEPYDLISLLSDIEIDINSNDSKKYIRINDLDLPWNFVNGDVPDIISMSEHWLSWSAFTIFATGTMLPEVVRISHILSEHWLFVDVFILNKLNFELDEKMKTLISNNNNIMFILDLFNSKEYEKFIKGKLKDHNIKFICPDYNKITTVFDEYRFEEALFNADGLVERLR